MEAKGGNWCLREVVSGSNYPTVLLDVVVADGQSIAGRSQSEFASTWSPLRDQDGELDIDIDEHLLPLHI